MSPSQRARLGRQAWALAGLLAGIASGLLAGTLLLAVQAALA